MYTRRDMLSSGAAVLAVAGAAHSEQGTPPGDIPFYEPTIIKLAINLKTAKSLAISIPPSMLTEADEMD